MLVLFFSLILLCSNAFSQAITVTGTVTSQADGTTLPGVTVMVKGTTQGTTTDINGQYTLQVNAGSALEFSFIGMLSEEIRVETAGIYNVALYQDLISLSEVVVTALGIKRERKSLGYALQEVSGDAIMESREANLANALTGKVSGLQVMRSSAGPAGSSKIVLRGYSSLTGDNQPLIVVDGLPVNNFTGAEENDFWNPGLDKGNGLADINPEDIESISVLKGASAAALYGSRAGNGVILITTKKGTQKPGMGINFTSSLGIESFFMKPELQSAFGQGSDGIYNAESSSSWGPRIEGQSIIGWDNQTCNMAAYDNLENYFDLGVNQNYNLSLQQQYDNLSLYTSVTHRNDKSMIPGAKLQRTNLMTRGVTSFGASNRWSVDAKVQYVNTVANNRPLLGSNQGNPYLSMFLFPRSMDITDFKAATNDVGNMLWYPGGNRVNPYWSKLYNLNEDSRDRFIMQGTLKYDVNSWLNAEVSAGSDMYSTNSERKLYAGGSSRPNGSFETAKENFFEHNISTLVSARKDNLIDRLGISGSMGGNIMMQEYSRLGINAENLVVPNLFTVDNSSGNPDLKEAFYQKRILSTYGTAQLNWDNYLFLDATLRNDWSSTLSQDNRSFLYPSLSASYVFTEMMEVMRMPLPQWFTFGKLRASYAQVGNALPPYQLYNTYKIERDPNNNLIAVPSSNVLFNPNVKSELITSQEIGLDLRFFQNRLSFDVAWYKTNATNQLIDLPIDPMSGYSFKKINAGDIENTGMELMVNGRILERRNGLNWQTQVNVSRNENKILKLHPESDAYRLGGYDALSITANEGEKYGDIYGSYFRRVTDENSPHYGQLLLSATGFPQAADGSKKLGNQQPDAMVGWSNTFSYKGVSLGFQIDGRFGGEIFSGTNQILQSSGTAAITAPGNNRDMIVVKGVVPDGNGGFTPNTVEITPQQYWTTVAAGNMGINEANIYDATNIRLRNVSLNYELPKRFLASSPFQAVRMGVSVHNVWMIKSHMRGVDPEAVYATGTNALGFENAAPPTTRSFLFNLNVSL